MPISMMAVSNATLGMGQKTFKAINRGFASGVSKIWKQGSLIKSGKAPVFKGDVKGASQFYPKKQVAAVRSANFGPSSPSSSTSSWTAHKNSQKGL